MEQEIIQISKIRELILKETITLLTTTVYIDKINQNKFIKFIFLINLGAYRYHNNPSNEGQKSSNFYDTGNGHSFYRQNGSGGYQYHENSNQGFRDYRPNGNKK